MQRARRPPARTHARIRSNRLPSARIRSNKTHKMVRTNRYAQKWYAEREGISKGKKDKTALPSPPLPPPFDDEEARNSIMNAPESPSANPIAIPTGPTTAQLNHSSTTSPPLLRSARTVPKRTQTHTRAHINIDGVHGEAPLASEYVGSRPLKSPYAGAGTGTGTSSCRCCCCSCRVRRPACDVHRDGEAYSAAKRSNL